MSMNGIDISSYQGSLDLSNIAYDFVIIKATQGTGYVNPSCDLHYQEAKAQGKKRGVYHYTNFGDPIAEANYFVDSCAGYINDAIFMLDWEGTGVGNTAWALQFLQHVESRIGYKPCIYMSEYVENTYNWSAVVGGDYGLVAAKYSQYEIENNYDMSNAGQAPTTKYWPFYFAWQWTSEGRINGYAGDLDCDIAYIDGAAWDKYAGVQAAAPTTTTLAPDPTPDSEPITTTTTTEIAPPPAPDATTTTTTTAPADSSTPVSATNGAPVGTTTTTTQSQTGAAAPPSNWVALWTFLIAVFNRLRGDY